MSMRVECLGLTMGTRGALLVALVASLARHAYAPNGRAPRVDEPVIVV